ncbi:HelD family protein [Demetria terragena]|uniref:HelD family protein n=1 Tax=Demetria terragena TaxID=63959 RepID=UPI00058AC49F|nr:AAA family ATPase [Demetria terragena]
MPDHPPDTSGPSELAREQHYLDHARAQLARMRAAVERLDASKASDADSGIALGEALARRVAALQDDPRTTLFFGRVDTVDDEAWYIGRRHVSDAHGEPVVIDWRAPVSTAFYRASRTAPMGVVRRRRFGVDRGALTAIEDENLVENVAPQKNSHILAAEIERPRSGPMRDIVATIQPEQDIIVRADVGTTICVQGAPGTGKTAVGLHRAAWLLYSFRDRLDRSGVLVVGPNAAFLDHVSAVLPALGEARVGHDTLETLLQHGRVRAVDSAEVAVLKGDSRLAEVVRRAVWAHVRAATEPLVVPRGVRKWRIPAYDVQEILDELMSRGVRYEAARAMLPQRLAHAVLLKLERSGESPDDRVQDTVARSAPMKAYVSSIWPAIDAQAVLFGLWSNEEALAQAADGILSPEKQALLRWDKAPRTKGAARWTDADMALLDEITDQVQRTPSLGHVVLDEAQDLSPMQLRAVGRRSSTGSLTVLGDIAQGTTPWSTTSWEESMAHLGKSDYHLEVLDRGFRVPAAVIEYAAQLLPHMAPGLGMPVSVRDNPGRLDIVPTSTADLHQELVRRVLDAQREPGSIGIIAPDAQIEQPCASLTAAKVPFGRLDQDHGDGEDHDVQVVPASVAKGLEFDTVLVLEPRAIAEAEPDARTGLRRLYVVLTRAVSTLVVLHSEPLPEALSRT